MFPWNFFPFNKEMQAKMQQMNPEDINLYIKEMMEKMSKAFHPSFQSNTNPLDIMKGFNPTSQTNEFSGSQVDNVLKFTVFETHDDIFVRISIDNEDWLKQLKLFHTSNLLIIENIPHNGEKHTIPLPSIVRKKGTTAIYKEQMLEVRIPKNIDLQYSEVEITDSP